MNNNYYCCVENALYRVGSQIASKLPNHNSNTTVNVYDRSSEKKVPTESSQNPASYTNRDSFAMYSIPTGTLVPENGQINHNIEAQVTVEPPQEDSHHRPSPYQIKISTPPGAHQSLPQTDTPSPQSQPCQDSVDTPSNQSAAYKVSTDTPSLQSAPYKVPTDASPHSPPPYKEPTETPSHSSPYKEPTDTPSLHQTAPSSPSHQSPPYQVPTNIPSQQFPPYQVPRSTPSHLSPYQVPTGCPITSSGEESQCVESGDYIYMGTPDITDEDEPETNEVRRHK